MRKTAKNTINIGFIFSFWKRRWFRTLPNYYLILTLLILQAAIFRNGVPDSFYKYYLFIQNFAKPHPQFFPEAWSLSVEEWFYILIPLSVIAVYRLFKNLKFETALYIVCFSILGIVGILRYIKFSNLGITDDFDSQFRKQVVYRLDSLMYGVIAAALLFYHQNFWNKYRKFFLTFGIAMLLFNQIYQNLNPSPFYTTNISFIFESLSVMLLLPTFYGLKLKNKKLKYVITHISISSYSMYLVNLTICRIIILNPKIWEPLYDILKTISSNAHTVIWGTKYLIYWIVTILFSTILYKYYEVPTTKLRDRFK